MLGDKDVDALDTLRRYVKAVGRKSAHLKPDLTIQNGVVEAVKIKHGDEEFTLKAGEAINI